MTVHVLSVSAYNHQNLWPINTSRLFYTSKRTASYLWKIILSYYERNSFFSKNYPFTINSPTLFQNLITVWSLIVPFKYFNRPTPRPPDNLCQNFFYLYLKRHDLVVTWQNPNYSNWIPVHWNFTRIRMGQHCFHVCISYLTIAL